MEISRLESLVEERAPVLSLITKYRELLDDKEQLAISANDASRLMSRGMNGARDPSRLLREEKMRKRVAKELPRVEVELKKALEKWEDDYGEPLLVKGENYLETLLAHCPVAPPSRAATKTPIANRGRANTTSSLSNYNQASQQRAKSRPNVKETAEMRPPQRPKTPGPRPKTPGAQLGQYSGASTLSRTIGKNLASTIGRTATPVLGATPSLGSGIVRPGSCIPQGSPTRMNSTNSTNRPALSNFYNIGSASERKELAGTPTIGRNASIKRKLGPGLGAAPKIQPIQSETQKQPTSYQRHQVQEESREEEEMRSSRGSGSIRSIRSIRSISPEPELPQYSTYNDGAEEEIKSTPRVDNFRPKSMYELGYGSSTRGSHASSDSRQLSISTMSTVSCVSTPGHSGSENWETYGEESEYGDDTEPDPRTAYYRERLRSTYSIPEKSSVGLVRRDGQNDEEWTGEATY
jgi:protein regulator of cytokinesis 1